MTPVRPGFHPKRLVRLMRERVARCSLDLRGLSVYTEAASGAYVVTPILAALAGASRVTAETRDSRYGTADEIASWTRQVAREAGVSDRIRVVGDKDWGELEKSDIVTNSGFVRPITADLVLRLKTTAAVPLMYESWEYRPADLDLAACRRHGIAVAGTNECHPEIDVFSYLGPLAARLLQDAGYDVSGSRLLLLCDNPFAPFIRDHLVRSGAKVKLMKILDDKIVEFDYDTVLVALTPRQGTVLGQEAWERLSSSRLPPGVVQLWGDVDRATVSASAVSFWPPVEPPPGHMALLLSELGPEPILRLQTGGLKVAEVLARARVERGMSAQEAESEAEGSGWGQILK